MTQPAPRIGDRATRLEDERLVRGRGQYLEDLQIGGCLHAVVLRSPHAHALISRIDVERARSMPGVVLVWTAEDLDGRGIKPLLPSARVNAYTNQEFVFDAMPALARDKVRYVGEGIAWVVAADVETARDAAEAIAVDYTPLPAVMNLASATETPAISDDVPDNCCLAWNFGDHAQTEDAFATAAHVVSVSLHNHRIAAQPMENRAALAYPAMDDGQLVLRLASQNVHVMRDHVARSLNLPSSGVRVIAEDVGGGFGSRNFPYQEYVLTAAAARELAQPVRWVNERAEGCATDHPSRDVQTDASLALDSNGQFLGLRVRSRFNAGAYMTGVACGVPTFQYAAAPTSVYLIGTFAVDLDVALTNTTPIGVTRGPGFAETIDPIERLIDKAARVMQIDRFELRRRNVVPASMMPWTNAMGTTFDSGDFAACLAHVEQRLRDLDVAVSEHEVTGVGIACHIKGTGGSPEENISYAFNDEQVIFTTGTQAIGQGHETSFRQIVTSLLGVTAEQIVYQAGDTNKIPKGGGHGSSRATFMASTAMSRAADIVVEKALPIAANMLEADVTDVEFVDGAFVVVGTDRSFPLLAVATEARKQGQSLDTYYHFERDALTWPNGCHAAVVALDQDTGRVRLLHYLTADDHGVMVNPMLVEGQSHGAIMQGVSQALLEQLQYDQSGQLLTGSYMDYAMPRADDLPEFDTHFLPTRCTTNPVGVKGAGEPGAIAGYPAVANAIADALHQHGCEEGDLRGIASSQAIWERLCER